MIVSLAVGAGLLLAAVCLSCYGAATLPSGARIPVHFGAASYNNYMSKRVGLVVWPAGGALIYALLAGIMTSRGHAGSAGSLGVILPLVLALLLAFHAGAITVAVRRSGR